MLRPIFYHRDIKWIPPSRNIVYLKLEQKISFQDEHYLSFYNHLSLKEHFQDSMIHILHGSAFTVITINNITIESVGDNMSEHKTKSMSLNRWMRTLHRDVGFLIVGLTIVYTISGFVLLYRDTSIFMCTTHVEKTIKSGLEASALPGALHIYQRFKVLGDDGTTIRFTNGTYDKKTGLASYEMTDFCPIVKPLTTLHFVSSKKGKHVFVAIYAVLLLFLALSSFWMYKPGNRLFKRGMILVLIGGVAAVLLVL